MAIIELPFMFYVDLMNIRNLLKSEEYNDSPFKNIMTKEWYDYYKKECDKYYDILQNILLKLFIKDHFYKSLFKMKLKKMRINEIMELLIKRVKEYSNQNTLQLHEASFMKSILNLNSRISNINIYDNKESLSAIEDALKIYTESAESAKNGDFHDAKDNKGNQGNQGNQGNPDMDQDEDEDEDAMDQETTPESPPELIMKPQHYSVVVIKNQNQLKQ